MRSVEAIRGKISDYVIEPIRHELGYSRVEMVDDHLSSCVRDGRLDDVDALLDARLRYAEEVS